MIGLLPFSSVHFLCIVLFVLVADLHADLSGDGGAVETKIVSRLRAIEMGTIDDESQDSSVMATWMSISERLGFNRLQIFARRTNSISLMIICDSAEELRLLRDHFDSGLVKEVLQELFTVLADQPVEISHLEWTKDQYDSCVHHFGMLYVMFCIDHYLVQVRKLSPLSCSQLLTIPISKPSSMILLFVVGC